MRLIRPNVVLQVVSTAVLIGGCRHRREPPAPIVYGIPRDYVEVRRVVRTRGPLPSSRVPPGELVGVVLDEQNGEPIARARVTVTDRPYAPGDFRATETDSAGRFRVRLLPAAAAVTFSADKRPTRFLPLTVNPDSGYVVVAAMERAVVLACTLFMGDAMIPGVVVIARDVVTGNTVPAPVTVIANSGAFRDSIVVDNVERSGRLARVIAGNRPGSYSVAVRADGYREWNGTSSTRPTPGCESQFIPAVFHAWLMPR